MVIGIEISLPNILDADFPCGEREHGLSGFSRWPTSKLLKGGLDVLAVQVVEQKRDNPGVITLRGFRQFDGVRGRRIGPRAAKCVWILFEFGSDALRFLHQLRLRALLFSNFLLRKTSSLFCLDLCSQESLSPLRQRIQFTTVWMILVAPAYFAPANAVAIGQGLKKGSKVVRRIGAQSLREKRTIQRDAIVDGRSKRTA